MSEAEIDLRIKLDAYRRLRQWITDHEKANPDTPPSVPLWRAMVKAAQVAGREDPSES